MRKTVSLGLTCVLLGFISNILYGQENGTLMHTELEDPIFGVSFDYTKVHYDLVPTSIRHACPHLATGTYWIFAHARQNSNDYLVVMGVVPGQSGDSLGHVVRIENSKCDQEDSTWMLSGFIPPGGYTSTMVYSGELPGANAPKVCDGGPFGSCHYVLRSEKEETIIRDLVRDAISRAVRAWDGKGFKKHACQPAIQQQASLMPIVQQELKNFCADSQ